MSINKSALKPLATVTVDYPLLRKILDYLHDSEADHYDPEHYPEDAETHVYAFVLAIEEQLRRQLTSTAHVPATSPTATDDRLTEAIQVITFCEAALSDPEAAERKGYDVRARRAVYAFMDDYRAQRRKDGQP